MYIIASVVLVGLAYWLGVSVTRWLLEREHQHIETWHGIEQVEERIIRRMDDEVGNMHRRLDALVENGERKRCGSQCNCQ